LLDIITKKNAETLAKRCLTLSIIILEINTC
jgi:hypothetical protein